MKNLDQFSKKMLSISLSLSMVLIAASLFIFSIKGLTAKNPAPITMIPPAVASENYCPLGISNGYVYYFFMNGSTIEFSKVSIAVAKDFSENYK